MKKPHKIYLTRNDKYFLTSEDASIEHAEIGDDPRNIEELDLYGLQTHNEKIARAAFEAARNRFVYRPGTPLEISDWQWKSSAEYLQSPEYKELVGAK